MGGGWVFLGDGEWGWGHAGWNIGVSWWHGCTYITGHLWGESTSDWWIPLTKGQQFIAFIFSLLLAWTSCWTNNEVDSDFRCPDTVMARPSSLWVEYWSFQVLCISLPVFTDFIFLFLYFHISCKWYVRHALHAWWSSASCRLIVLKNDQKVSNP